MQSYVIDGQWGLENLKQTEHPEPEPGPGEVLVSVKACSLNYRDWLMLQGRYNPRIPLPLIPLSDGAGEVAAVGEGVTRFQVGDRVAAIFNQTWDGGEPTRERLRTTMGGPLDGMLTQKRVLPESGLVRVPDHLSIEQAATLPCAGVTAWSAIAKYGRLKPGESVLVQGTGGVSIFALQLAKLFGARVIVTSSSDEKLERAKKLGADETINYVGNPDWHKEVRALTGKVGADHIVEVGGAGTLEKSLKAARIGGSVYVIGVLAGNSSPLNILPILMSSVRLQGVTVGSRDDFEAMNAAFAHNKLEPVVDKVFAFDEAKAAFEHLAAAKHFGKVVVRVG